MKRLIIATGLIAAFGSLPGSLLAQSASSASSSSAPSTLYTRIKAEVQKENTEGVFDDEVVTFIRLLYKDTWKLTDEQVKDVLKGNVNKACNDAPQDVKLHDNASCQEMGEIVQSVAQNEQKTRALGRRLTTLVSGYELPLSDLPERTMRFSTDLLGILNIWSAGTGSVLSQSDAPDIRTITVEESAVRPQLEQVAEELNKLSPEERIAAVWRLRAGARLVTDQRMPVFPEPLLPDSGDTDGTERQYLGKNWEDLENRLKQLWTAVYNIRIDPPLSSTETAYAVFPQGLVKQLMPDNIIVWVRIDGDPKNAYADVGLEWGIPLDPVQPSLKKDGEDEAIPGGTFPPEPVTEDRAGEKPLDGMTLCTNPLARRGYLCRPYETVQPDERCPVEVPADTDTISLVHCTVTADKTKSTLQWCATGADKKTCRPLDPVACTKASGVSCGTLEDCQKKWGCTASPAPAQPMWCCLKKAGNVCAVTTSSSECVQRGGSPSQDEKSCVQNGCTAPAAPDIRYTNAGADVCREIQWKNRETFDPNTQCTLNVTCAASCDPRNGVEGLTKPKEASGKINVCIQEKTTGAATYIVYHELVHAYQHCSLRPGATYEVIPPTASVQQKANIRSRNTERCCRIEGEAFRLQCAMMERDGLFDNAGSVDGIPVNAQTCAEYATNNACGPRDGFNGCFTSYTYTQPFIDQLGVLTRKNPKELPATCADAINPQKMDPRVKALKELVETRDDVCTPTTQTQYRNRIGNNMCYIGQCAEQSLELHRITAGRSTAGVQDGVAPWQEPMTGTPLGTLLTNPPLAQYTFPPYRPQLLAETLDAALCQSVGLPPLLPPVLCAVEATRQLQQTRAIGFESVIGLVGQSNEQESEIRDLLELSRGIGVRTGTELYSDYLRESNRSFAEIIGTAAELLRQLDSINFPTEMCPVKPGLPPSSTSSAS
jgi:hypothetical protein